MINWNKMAEERAAIDVWEHVTEFIIWNEVIGVRRKCNPQGKLVPGRGSGDQLKQAYKYRERTISQGWSEQVNFQVFKKKFSF